VSNRKRIEKSNEINWKLMKSSVGWFFFWLLAFLRNVTILPFLCVIFSYILYKNPFIYIILQLKSYISNIILRKKRWAVNVLIYDIANNTSENPFQLRKFVHFHSKLIFRSQMILLFKIRFQSRMKLSLNR